MKTHTTIGISLVIIIVSVVFWSVGGGTAKGAGHTNTQLATSSEPTATNKTVETELIDMVEKYRQGLISKAELMRQVWDGENATPQDFYGKVVDQYGQAINGASVLGTLMWIQGYDVGEKREQHTTHTDGNGEFQFTGLHGWRLATAVRKEGYQIDERGKAYKGPTNGGKTTPSDRAVFTMWKLKGPEAMVHPDIHAYIPCDGTAVGYNLLTGKKVANGGDLIVKLLRNPVDIEPRKHFDWSISMVISNGGFIEIRDVYPNEAPVDGYQSIITTNVQADMKSWTDEITRSYYFKCRNGKMYGRMKVLTQANFQPPPTLFDVDIYINPSGSRNLEYDRAKEIEPSQVLQKQASQ